MTKSKYFASSAIAALAAVAMTSSVYAADLAEPEPMAPVDLWSGFHVGIGGGGAYDMFKAGSYTDNRLDWVDGANSGSLSLPYTESGGNLGRASAFGTVEVGYDWQFNDQFVMGILGSFDFGKGKYAKLGGYKEVSYDGDYDRINANVDIGAFAKAGVKVRRKNSWFIGGRLGFLATERSQWYGLLGYTQAKIQGKAFYDAGVFYDGYEDGVEGSASRSKKRGGFTIGGGAETLLTEDGSVSAKLEYRYTNFKNLKWSREDVESLPGLGFGGEDWQNVSVNGGRIKMSEHSVRAVVSWRFNNLFQ